MSPARLSSLLLFNLLLQVAESRGHGVFQSWWPGVEVTEVGITGQLVEVAVGAKLGLARPLLVGVAAISMVGGVGKLGH